MVKRLLLMIAVGAACGPREVPIEVRLVTGTCSGPEPFAEVSHLQFRVTGEGLEPPIEVETTRGRGAAQLPPVPAGRLRQLEVFAWAGAVGPPGRLVSYARSPQFDVPAELTAAPEPLELTLFLRAVDGVTLPNLADSPQSCSAPAQPRSGHSATSLADGRVLLAGGYVFDGAGLPVASATTELFDPRSGRFEAGPALDVPRAFHTATLLPDGRVFVAGGEAYDAVGAAVPVPSALVLDVSGNAQAEIVPLTAARTRHQAAVDREGRVLLLGGVDAGGALVGDVEWWSAEAARVTEGAESFFRRGGAALALSDGTIVVAGGEIGSGTTDLVQFFAFDDALGTFAATHFPILLDAPRRAAAIASLGQDRVLVVGGYANADAFNPMPLATTEVVVAAETPTREPGPNFSPRGDACAVAVGPGRVLTAGGRGLDPGLFPFSVPTVELILQPEGAPGAVLGLPPLPIGRVEHTCTALPDGTVLVIGGVREAESGELTVLGDAAILSPRP